MKRFLFLLLFVPVLALAGDYVIVRDAVIVNPGANTSTVSWYPAAPVSGELLELQVFHGVANTAAISRVSYDGYVTNAIATLTVGSSCTVTNWAWVTWEGTQRDKLLITSTASNLYYFAPVYKQHSR